MIEVCSNRPVWLFAVIAWIAIIGGNLCRAQVANVPVPLPVDVAVPASETSGPDELEQFVFSNAVRAGSPRNNLERTLQLKVDDVARVGGFTEAQREKLEMAGRGDIKRFFDQIDQLRPAFQRDRNDPNKAPELLREAQPLRAELQSGLFGDGSLFSKTLKRTLTSDQAAEYEKANEARKAVWHRATVEAAVTTLDNSLGMRDEQRRRLTALLLEKTQPPRKLGQYDQHVVLLQLTRIPDATLKPIFDARQWHALQQLLPRYVRMEPVLKENGYLPE